jgi:leucyl aminopeptidase
MLLTVEHRSAWDVEADVLAVAVPADPEASGRLAELDARLGGALSALRGVGALRGKLWETRLMPAVGLGVRFVLAVGIGDGRELDRQGLRRLGAVVARGLAGCEARRLVVDLPDELLAHDGVPLTAAVELLVRGTVEGSADPATIYGGPADGAPPLLDACTIVVQSGETEALRSAARRGQVIGEGANRTRRLAARAANDVSPEVLADEASDLAREHDLEARIIGPTEAAELGMGLFVAVGRGSANEPRFITLRSRPDRSRDPRGRLLALVGKGVTFDSGGISLKPATHMADMKYDKTGAATVMHALASVAQLAPDLPVLAVAPAVENMPGPHSTRPGDVVRGLNGKSVEIANTDAEGRLILADALTWAEQQGATHVVDVATLTGAMTRALGRYVTGGFGAPDAWWAEVAAAAERQGEALWRMPLEEDYRKDIDTPFADVSNLGIPEGSTLTAALFLREFVTVPWVHLDIAGTAYLEKPDPWAARGATGVMHATLVDLCLAEGARPPARRRRRA